MVTISKMRLGFESAVRTAPRSQLKSRVVRSLKKRIGVRYNKGGMKVTRGKS